MIRPCAAMLLTSVYSTAQAGLVDFVESTDLPDLDTSVTDTFLLDTPGVNRWTGTISGFEIPSGALDFDVFKVELAPGIMITDFDLVTSNVTSSGFANFAQIADLFVPVTFVREYSETEDVFPTTSEFNVIDNLPAEMGTFIVQTGPSAAFCSPSPCSATWTWTISITTASADEGLISYWSFDDGTATDQAGANDGILLGGVSATGGGVDMAPIANNSDALRFDGILSEVQVPNDPSLDFAATDSFTLSMWFKRETDRPIYHLLGKRSGCSLSINYQLARDFGLLHFNWARVNANVDAGLGEWVHMASTYDGTDSATARIYVDGVLKETVSPLALGPVVDADLKIGSSGACPDDQRFQGVIDEVRIYDRVLSAQEVAALAGSAGNEAPVADAGPDQSARVGDVVVLDGAASFDDNTATTDLLFDWTFSSLPAGSAAALANQDTVGPSFFIDVAGSYEIELTVTDGAGLSSVPDSVAVSSLNLAPSSNAGSDQLVVVGSTVMLDGSGSTDPENDPLAFSWTLSTPVGSVAQLAGPDSVAPSFIADVPGVYAGALTVSDAIGPGAPDAVDVTAASPGDFVQIQIVTADAVIVALPRQAVTTQGNQTALGNFLAQATIAIQMGDVAEAVDKLEKVISRTDGCILNGVPDGNGPGRDWVTDCAEQIVLYGTLNAALEALP